MVNILTSFMKLVIVIRKNIKRLLSSKVSAAMIIFGPLIMIALLGIAFQNSGFFNVKVGTYASNYSDISDQIIDSMKSNGFEITKETNLENCVQGVSNGESNVCIHFPYDFKKDKMEFYVDQTRLNLVYIIINKISGQIDLLSSNISLSATQDMLNFIKESSVNLEDSRKSLIALKQSAGLLNEKLGEMDSQINSFDASSAEISEADRLDTVRKLDKALKNVQETKAELKNTQDDLIIIEDDYNKISSNINEAINAFQCNPSLVGEIKSELDSDEFVSELVGSVNPTCSLLFTTKETITKNKEKISETNKKIESYIKDLDDLEHDLKETKSQFNHKVKSTNELTTQLEGTQKNMTTGISGIQRETAQTTKSLDEMTKGLDKMLDAFNEVSLTDANSVVKPIKTSIKSLNSKKFETMDLMFSSILIMVTMFVSILLGNIMVMKEKTTKAKFRNLIAPTKGIMFIIGSYLTTLFITAIQLFIVITIGLLVFKTNIVLLPLQILAIIILGIIVFTSIGMLIAYLMKSEETSVLTAVIISVILLIFSNVVIPLETMNITVSMIAKFSPFNMIELLLRRSLLFGANVFKENLFTFIAIIIQIIVLVFLTIQAHVRKFEKEE